MRHPPVAAPRWVSSLEFTSPGVDTLGPNPASTIALQWH
jgi:hypothetical protein